MRVILVSVLELNNAIKRLYSYASLCLYCFMASPWLQIMLFWKLFLKFALQDVTKGDSHQLMLARLDWELEQRKRYSNQIYSLIHKGDQFYLWLSPWSTVEFRAFNEYKRDLCWVKQTWSVKVLLHSVNKTTVLRETVSTGNPEWAK